MSFNVDLVKKMEKVSNVETIQMNKWNEIVCIIGAGYVGGPTAAVFAKHCKNSKFIVADINQERINSWNTDKLPIYEPGLCEIVKKVRGKNLFFTTDVRDSIEKAGIIFIAVNTGTKEFGEGEGLGYDLSAFEAVARTIAKHSRNDKVVVEKSTIPVGTCEVLKNILKNVARTAAIKDERKNIPKFSVISNPEFLAEGVAIRDLEKPMRVILGSEYNKDGLEAVNRVASLYRNWVPNHKIITIKTFSSELTKLASNAMLAQRISSVNSLSAICENTGANMDEVSVGIGRDNRIGDKYLKCSLGFGGSCFKKDVLGLSYICDFLGLKDIAKYWRMVIEINTYQTKRFCKRIYNTMNQNLKNKTVVLFGFAFKANTGDIRESAAIYVTKFLLNEKANVKIYDPQVKHSDILNLFPDVHIISDPINGCEGAQALIICTEWNEFRTYNYQKIYNIMELPAYIFDGRNILNLRQLQQIGFKICQIGK